MAVSPGDVIRVTAVLAYDAVNTIQNVFYVEHQGVTDVSDDDFMEAAALWLDTAYGNLLSLQPAATTYTTVQGYNVGDDVPLLPEPWPTLTSGSSSDQGLPLQVAGLVSFATTTKRSVGRKYIGGLSEGAQAAGGLLDATAVVGLENWGTDILNGFVVTAEVFVPGNFRPLTNDFIDWERRRVDPVMRTQRRRVKGVGI